MQETISVTDDHKITWSLREIANATGLSLNFLRYEVRRGNIAIRRFGRRVLVRDQDLKDYVEKGSLGAKG